MHPYITQTFLYPVSLPNIELLGRQVAAQFQNPASLSDETEGVVGYLTLGRAHLIDPAH